MALRVAGPTIVDQPVELQPHRPRIMVAGETGVVEDPIVAEAGQGRAPSPSGCLRLGIHGVDVPLERDHFRPQPKRIASELFGRSGDFFRTLLRVDPEGLAQVEQCGQAALRLGPDVVRLDLRLLGAKQRHLRPLELDFVGGAGLQPILRHVGRLAGNTDRIFASGQKLLCPRQSIERLCHLQKHGRIGRVVGRRRRLRASPRG